MKYYAEEHNKQLRLALDEVLRWPWVATRKMFGVQCYLARGRLFAFLVTGGVVITKLGQADREALFRQPGVTAFRGGDRIYRTWVRVPVEGPGDLVGVMPLVRKSYESVLGP